MAAIDLMIAPPILLLRLAPYMGDHTYCMLDIQDTGEMLLFCPPNSFKAEKFPYPNL